MNEPILRTWIVEDDFAEKLYSYAIQRVFGTKLIVACPFSPSVERLSDFTVARNIAAFTQFDELIVESKVPISIL